MKKIIYLMLLALFLTGCGNKDTQSDLETVQKVEEEAGWDYVFTDVLGRTVVVNQPKRVAALLGSFAGRSHCLCG